MWFPALDFSLWEVLSNSGNLSYIFFIHWTFRSGFKMYFNRFFLLTFKSFHQMIHNPNDSYVWNQGDENRRMFYVTGKPPFELQNYAKFCTVILRQYLNRHTLLFLLSLFHKEDSFFFVFLWRNWHLLKPLSHISWSCLPFECNWTSQDFKNKFAFFRRNFDRLSFFFQRRRKSMWKI